MIYIEMSEMSTKYQHTLGESDIQLILIAKGNFDKLPGTKIDKIKKVLAFYGEYKPEYLTSEDIVSILMGWIIEPFIIPHRPDRFINELIKKAAPNNVFRANYRFKGDWLSKALDESIENEYDYYDAMIYSILSFISHTFISVFDPTNEREKNPWKVNYEIFGITEKQYRALKD